MKNVLLLCHDVPSLSVGATLPFYHLIKNLHDKYNLTLICFDSGKYDLSEYDDLLKNHFTLEINEYLSIKDQLTYTIKNMMALDNLKSRSFLNYYYNSNMSKLIKEHLDDVDIIISDMPMAFYVKNSNIKKIVYAFDAVSNYNYLMYKKADSLFSKIYWYMNYKKISSYEKCYNKFDECIVVNRKDKLLLEKKLSVNIDVVANGVDTDYFSKNDASDDTKLLFLGDMSTPPNNDAVKYFVNNIYPLILEDRDIKFYIVGRNPSSYIESLKSENIIVTGEVDDVRSFLSKNTIFITPMISGTGIKNKILEAMSMNLAVVSTSIGISGIDAEDNVHYLLGDSPASFKDAVIRLIDDEKFRYDMANNAREFVDHNYSWTKSANTLNKLIQEIILKK